MPTMPLLLRADHALGSGSTDGGLGKGQVHLREALLHGLVAGQQALDAVDKGQVLLIRVGAGGGNSCVGTDFGCFS